jgi:hypothetical protein
MAADSENTMKFPCYFLYGEEGGLITNMVDGRHCLCLFTSSEAVKRFTEATHDYMHGTERDRWQVAVDEVEDRAGLIDRLTNTEGRLAADGIKFISIDPVPGQPTLCGAIREFITDLPNR